MSDQDRTLTPLPKPEPGTLMSRTITLLRERNETLPHITEKTGIPFYWLRKFAGGEIDDPGVNRIQKLYEYLAGRKLEV